MAHKWWEDALEKASANAYDQFMADAGLEVRPRAHQSSCRALASALIRPKAAVLPDRRGRHGLARDPEAVSFKSASPSYSGFEYCGPARVRTRKPRAT